MKLSLQAHEASHYMVATVLDQLSPSSGGTASHVTSCWHHTTEQMTKVCLCQIPEHQIVAGKYFLKKKFTEEAVLYYEFSGVNRGSITSNSINWLNHNLFKMDDVQLQHGRQTHKSRLVSAVIPTALLGLNSMYYKMTWLFTVSPMHPCGYLLSESFDRTLAKYLGVRQAFQVQLQS